jgi:hypothetical protein
MSMGMLFTYGILLKIMRTGIIIGSVTVYKKEYMEELRMLGIHDSIARQNISSNNARANETKRIDSIYKL